MTKRTYEDWTEVNVFLPDDLVKHFDDLFVVVSRHECDAGVVSYMVQKPDTHILRPGDEGEKEVWDTVEDAIADAETRVPMLRRGEQ